ncbi:MAG TPA: hypothetical protein DCL61_11305 [Cyanobacteria bacterium UBA12227]|nr:hypothetical protein [Cyanobacteria bacterium UBA12227]HAX87274.1 hypothetical protein [Cyanobacteria bacterium UBA11370]HBY76993.1 hypothetical protein [Cyanobacteria bacterium UBA11148]
MSDSVIIYPDYIRVVERTSGGWLFKKGKMFYKRSPIAIDFQDFKLLYGISKQQVVTELFRVNGGKAGYYLADLRHKQYYYCGLKWEDIIITLQSLGIGQIDPIES